MYNNIMLNELQTPSLGRQSTLDLRLTMNDIPPQHCNFIEVGDDNLTPIMRKSRVNNW
jgi:hypothetical protein